MEINSDVLNNSEKISFALRALYRAHGYSQYRMSKFEEYDLYSRNKEFLVSDSVITFTDTNGRLMALKPDVTLSIVKNTRDCPGTVRKLCYNENVYRASKGNGAFREIMQAGLECIGDIDDRCIGEVLRLAAESLGIIGGGYELDVSDLSIVSSFVDAVTADEQVKKELIELLAAKNLPGIEAKCASCNASAEATERFIALAGLYGPAEEVLPYLKALSYPEAADEILRLERITGIFSARKAGSINIDFSAVSDLNYYNGIVFKGYINGIPESVISGGSYDRLMAKMGRSSGAIGFAVYLDLLDNTAEPSAAAGDEDRMLNIALPKGRLGDDVYGLLERAGYECPELKEPDRKLIFVNEAAGVRYFWVKPSDVAIYVERGAADIGFAGKDILLEYSPDVYELLDTHLGKCRMAVAGPADFDYEQRRILKVATKFPNITADFFASTGRQIDIIRLNGSIELAPILGLSDVIADIVESGRTLKANDLEVIEDIVPVSARLIANKASFRFKNGRIEQLVSALAAQTENKGERQ